MTPLARLETPVRRFLGRLDAIANRVYGWRWNPLYQSGTLVVVLLVVLLITGIWLLFFYRIGAPWESVDRITAALWWGNWVRGLHRYASDAAILAALVHLLRMFAQGRSWGPRVLAWVSGVVMLGVILVSGWTGYVMVWDRFGLALAAEGARLFDALPMLSEPIARLFTGERPVPSAFFFLNLFLHVALPLGVGAVLWIHLIRVARPVLLPPRGLLWGTVVLLTLVAVVWPLDMAPKADPLIRPDSMPADWWYGFWLPFTTRASAAMAWAVMGLPVALLVAVPWLVRRRPDEAPSSTVDPRSCTDCRQCPADCPYEAITMVPRTDGRFELVASVDPKLCVSCGICSGSCAPMGVGPPGRTGRDQLAVTRRFLAEPSRRHGEVVVLGCRHGAGAFEDRIAQAGAVFREVDCVGNLHSSVIEFHIRAGAGGVLVFSCPPRDCQNREGPRWLSERLYHGREAELKPRVDRRRLRVVWVGPGEWSAARRALEEFRIEIEAMEPVQAEPDLELQTVCEPATALAEEPA